MKTLFATVMILALAGCTTPHYRGGKQHKTNRSAIPCCQQETCKCAVTMKGKSWSNNKKADWNTRSRRLREAVQNGDMTPEGAREKAGDMRRKKGEQHPRGRRKNSNRSTHPRR